VGRIRYCGRVREETRRVNEHVWRLLSRESSDDGNLTSSSSKATLKER
jgi:hypothetical protein